jgi:hypothetical protein
VVVRIPIYEAGIGSNSDSQSDEDSGSNDAVAATAGYTESDCET